MGPVSHQTIRLSRGKHSSPDEGACAMELASMLGGEPFTDHPASVCPVIGAFLRAYNDIVSDGRRQDLYRYAAAAVGSKGSRGVQRARAERLAAWRIAMIRRRLAGFMPRPIACAITAFYRVPHHPESLGTRAVFSIENHTRDTHRAALRLLDELLAIHERDTPLEISSPTELIGVR